jgi:hypothetical protein
MSSLNPKTQFFSLRYHLGRFPSFPSELWPYTLPFLLVFFGKQQTVGMAGAGGGQRAWLAGAAATAGAASDGGKRCSQQVAASIERARGVRHGHGVLVLFKPALHENEPVGLCWGRGRGTMCGMARPDSLVVPGELNGHLYPHAMRY